MPRPGGPRVQEKSKDFKGSMIRLIKNLNPWKYMMSIALILALVSSVLALVAPNKLSDFADVIGAGLVPDTDKLQEVGTKIGENLASSDTSERMQLVFTELELTLEEKSQTEKVLSGMIDTSKEAVSAMILELPDKVLEYIISDIEIDGVTISSKDQIAVLRLSLKLGNETNTDSALKMIDELPVSVYNYYEMKTSGIVHTNVPVYSRFKNRDYRGIKTIVTEDK